LEIHPVSRLRGVCYSQQLHQGDQILAALTRVRRVHHEGALMLLEGEQDEVEIVLKAT
jgi:hypothetical protein